MRDLCSRRARRGDRRRAPPTPTRGRCCGARRSVATKNGQVDTVSDTESEGIGVRVLVDGAWGFACDRRLDPEGAREAALRAPARSRAPRRPGVARSLAPVRRCERHIPHAGGARPVRGLRSRTRSTLCLRAERAMAHADVKVTLGLRARAARAQGAGDSDGGDDRAGARRDRRRHRRDRSARRRRPDAQLSERARRLERQAGWEYVEGLGLERRGAARRRAGARAPARRRVPRRAARRSSSTPEQMALQVHESVGHPTELDRVYGTEAAYAGHELPRARRPRLPALRLATDERHRRRDDAARPRHVRLRRRGRRRPRREPIVVEGVLRGFLTSRETAGAARRGQRRLDARRRLEPDAARADDEPPPRAGRGLPRGAARRTSTRASTSRRTRAGRSTTSGSTSSSARRSPGRSRTASSAGCSGTRPTRA